MSRSLCLQLLTVLLIIFGWNIAVSASTWRSLALAANKAANANHIEDAKKLWADALAAAEKSGNDNPCISISVRNLAYLYLISDKDIGKAERLFRRELSLLQPLGKNYPDLAYDFYNLGRIDAIQGKMQSSLEEYDRALQCCKRVTVVRELEPDTLAYMLVPCDALGKTEKETQCEEKLNAGVFRQERSWSATIKRLNDYASSINSDGKRAGGSTAPLFYKAAINLLASNAKLARAKVPLKDSQLEGLIHKQRALWFRDNLDDYQAAFDEIASALPIFEERAQQDPDTFGDMLHEAGNYLLLLGRNERAESFFKRSVEFLEKKNKLSADERWFRWKQIADMEAADGNFAESMRLYKGLALTTTTDGQRYLLFMAMSSWYHLNQDQKLALDNMRDAHLVCGKFALKTRIDYLLTLSDVCSVVSPTEAEKYVKEAITLADSVYKNDSSGLASVLINAGSRPNLAVPLRIAYIERTLALLKSKSDCTPSQRANALIARASCFISEGKPAESIRCASLALNLWRQLPGQETNQAASLALIAHAEVNQGDYHKVDEACQEYYACLQKTGHRPSPVLRAQFLALSGHYDQLENACRSAIAAPEVLDHDKGVIQYWRLLGLVESGRAAESVRLSDDLWLKKLARNRDWRGCVLLLQGRALSIAGNHQMAQAVFEDGIRELRQWLPTDWAEIEIANGRYYQANDLRDNNQPAQAEKAYIEALKLYPQVRTTWLDFRHQCQLSLEELRSSQREPSTKPISDDLNAVNNAH